jgi:hypothetical protein
MSIDVFAPPTRQEKEEMALYMYNQGKTYREIAKECHLSFADISRLIKVESGELGQDVTEKLPSKVSKETQAIKLFNEGKSPIKVAIQLDLPTDSVLVIYKKFQQLRNLDQFNSAYQQVEGNIVPFLQIFNATRSLGMNPQQVANSVKCANAFPQLQTMHSSLRNEVHALEIQKLNSECQLQLMADQKDDFFKELEYLSYHCDLKKKELQLLYSVINSKKPFVQNLDNDKGG